MALKTYLNYVNGNWVPSCTGETFDITNPADGTTVAGVQQSNETDIEAAIQAARYAFVKTKWRKDPALRSRALMQMAANLAEKKEELARLYTMDNGKTLNEARGELATSVGVIEYYAGMTLNVFGRVIEPAEDAFSVMVREPIGVVGIISPWNWPVLLMLRDLIPAMAAGNTIVAKPASITAAISMEVIKVLTDSGCLPAGVLNAVTGPGSSIGETMAKSDKIGMISFTGDNTTGRKVAELAARTVKKVALELGGKSPNVIFEDADLDKFIPPAVRAAFSNCGQICMAGSRLVVQDTIFDEVVARMKAAVESLKVGNGLEEGCGMGPLVSRKQLETVMKYIEIGKKEGELVTGGYRLEGSRYDNGFFVAPTIFTGLANDSVLVQEEIFGPVLVIQKFRSEEEAIALANGTRFGLAGAVWTSDVNRAFRVAKEIEAGTVWVNAYMKLYHQTEFGGCKASGIGRTRGVDGMLEYTEIKHINFDLDPA